MTSACSPLEEHLFYSFWAGNSFSVLVQALPLNELVFSQIPVFRRWGLSFKATCFTVSGKRLGCSLMVLIPLTFHCDAWPALSLSVAWNGSHTLPKVTFLIFLLTHTVDVNIWAIATLKPESALAGISEEKERVCIQFRSSSWGRECSQTLGENVIITGIQPIRRGVFLCLWNLSSWGRQPGFSWPFSLTSSAYGILGILWHKVPYACIPPANCFQEPKNCMTTAHETLLIRHAIPNKWKR